MLIDLGRITRDQVDQALEFQKLNGGYFGEALLALNLVTRRELDWVLATQFDLPYVVPGPDEVDLAAASLVTPEWAIAHTALPILDTGDALTVVLAEPNRENAALEQLGLRTGRQLRLALASPETIRDLIRSVFDRLAVQERSEAAPIPISLLFDSALRAGAAGFGVSARGATAWGWFRARNQIERRLLDVRWERDLHRLVDPAPLEAMNGRELGRWQAEMEFHGLYSRVAIACLRSRGGTELYIQPIDGGQTDEIPPPDHAIASELSGLVHSGGVRIRVVCDPPSLYALLLPRIPAIVLTDPVRSIHVTDHDTESPTHVVSLRLSTDAAEREAQLATIRDFRFDVVTAELSDPSPGELEEVAGLAPSLLAAVPEPDPDAARFDRFQRVLRIEGEYPGRLDWRLHDIETRSTAESAGVRRSASG